MADQNSITASLVATLATARAHVEKLADTHRLQRGAQPAEQADIAAHEAEAKRETPDPKKLEVLNAKRCAHPAEHERLARVMGGQLLLVPGLITELQTHAAPARADVLEGLRRYAVRTIGPLFEGPAIEGQMRNASAIPGLASCTLDNLTHSIVLGSDFAARIRALEAESAHLAAGDAAALNFAVQWAERCLAVHVDWQTFLAAQARAA